MVEETRGPTGQQGRLGGAVGPPRGGGLPSIVGTALAAAILLIAGGGVFAGGYFTNAAVDDDGGTAGPNPTAPTGTQTPVVGATATPPAVVDVSVDDDPSVGPDDAKVTVVEFSDFQ